MPERLIAARGVHTYYAASHILRGIDFHVDRGETIGLMGRNGMGKTTLLKSLMGIVAPRGGAVEVKGRNMVGRPPYEVAQLGIDVVEHDDGLARGRDVLAELDLRRGDGLIAGEMHLVAPDTELAHVVLDGDAAVCRGERRQRERA